MTQDIGVPEVAVLVEGYLVREGEAVVDASSTVTLVRAGAKNIVIDTGSSSKASGLVEALRGRGMLPEDIHIVVNTHLHSDHCGANEAFSNARMYAHGFECPPAGTFKVLDRTTLAPRVVIVPTPGHSKGSVSVFVDADRRYAVCGDAIPTRGNYEQRVPPAVHMDRRLAIRSMELILSWADFVVPGHDSPFEVSRKE